MVMHETVNRYLPDPKPTTYTHKSSKIMIFLRKSVSLHIILEKKTLFPEDFGVRTSPQN